MLTTAEHLSPVAISQIMINFAANHGVDRDTCLLGTGITERDLMEGEALITRAQEMRLIENLMLALPDIPALGFKLGLQYSVSIFGIWGFALRTCRTLREATDLAMRYLPLSTAYCRIESFDEPERFGISLEPESIPLHLRQFLLERDIATGINLLTELGLTGINVGAADFRGDRPPYAPDMERACGLKLSFNQSRNAILVAKEDADRPLPTYDASLSQMLDHQCRQQLQRRQAGGQAGRVRQLLLGPLGLVASLDEVARTLCMSARSLRRKLDQEGTSFRALVEEERRQVAQQLLISSDMKLDALAIHLGYTDTASFTRAFRRWENCSPGEYRKKHR